MAVMSLTTSRTSHRRSYDNQVRNVEAVLRLRDQMRERESSFGWYSDSHVLSWLKFLAIDPENCKASPDAAQRLLTQSLQLRELLLLPIDISTLVLDQFLRGSRFTDGKSGSSMSKRGRGCGRASPSQFIARTSSPSCGRGFSSGVSLLGTHPLSIKYGAFGLSVLNDSENRVAQRNKGVGTEEEGNASDKTDNVPLGDHVAQRNRVEDNPSDTDDDINDIENQVTQRRTITLKLIGLDEPVVCAYTWLKGEAGDEVAFNDNIRSWVIEGGDLIQVIQFQQGGEPVNIGDPIPNARGFWQAAARYICQAVGALFLYWAFGTLLYFTMTDPSCTKYLQDTQNRTNGTNGTAPVPLLVGVQGFDIVNSTYLLAVTLSSIGYGEIHPQEWSAYAKVFISVLMLVGCGLVAGRLSALVSFLSTALGRCVFGSLGRCLGQPIQASTRVKWSALFAIAVVICCIGFGTVVREKRGLLDSVYLSVSTLTTVGFGDLFYVSRHGKKFAFGWIPFGTTFVALAFGYLSTLGHWSTPSNMLFVRDAHI